MIPNSKTWLILFGIFVIPYGLGEIWVNYLHYFDMTQYELLIEYWWIHMWVLPVIICYFMSMRKVKDNA
jgi:hypothetical protein